MPGWKAAARAATALALLGCAPLSALGTQGRPRVHVIATGGTISNMGSDPRRTGAELVSAIQALQNVAEISTEQFSNVASGAITHDMWRSLAQRIRAMAREASAPAGYVITHGTDTMEETAYFLHLTVGGCAPVVLTGAMRQANDVGADGPANLLNAVRVAASEAARGRGALIVMNDEIFRAHDATKSNTSRMNAFTAPDAGPAGVTDPDGVVFYSPPPSGECPPPRFDLDALGGFPRVDVAYSYIGADSTAIDAMVASGARGIVVAGVGRGGATPSQGRALRRATERGVVVVYSNRTGSGRVGERADSARLASIPTGQGATFGAGDLNPQKARILLTLALAARLDFQSMATLFRNSP